MVPVDVGDERRRRAKGRRRVEGLAPEAEAGAEVEDDRVVTGGFERHARRVAAVATVLVTRARGRAPDAEEADVQQRISPLFPRVPPARYRRVALGAGRVTGVSRTRGQQGGRGREQYGPAHDDHRGPHHGQRRRLRVPRGRHGTAGAVPARLPRLGLDVALPAPGAGRRRLPRRGPVHARLRPHRRTRRRPLPDRPRSAWTPTRSTRRSAATATRCSSATTGAPWPPTSPATTSPSGGGGW